MLDVDILTGFGTILDPQTVSTSNLDWVAIAKPRGMVYYTLEVDAALITTVIASLTKDFGLENISVVTTCGFVPIDENTRAKRNRPRRRKKERRIKQLVKTAIG